MRGVSLSLFLGVALAGVPLAPAADGENARTTEVDGTWRLTGYIEDGRPNEDEVRANYRIVRTDGIQEITRAGKFFNKRVFKVDPRKMPRHIDFIDDKGAVVRGVYEIAGDAMRIAILADPERQRTDRPDDLGKEGKIVAVYERVRDRALARPRKTSRHNPSKKAGSGSRGFCALHQEDNRQRRFIYDDEIQTSPEPGKPIVIVREGS